MVNSLLIGNESDRQSSDTMLSDTSHIFLFLLNCEWKWNELGFVRIRADGPFGFLNFGSFIFILFVLLVCGVFVQILVLLVLLCRRE